MNYWLEQDKYDTIKEQMVIQIGKYLESKEEEFRVAVLDFDGYKLQEIRNGAVAIVRNWK